jgi:syntaxin 5
MSQDRTSEFQAALTSLRSRSPHQPLLQQAQYTPSQFTQQASRLSLRITTTADKLKKLSALAKRKTIFDDRPQEIQALSQQIKNEISEINAQIGGLQREEENSHKIGTRKEHTKGVLTSLQSSLAETTTVFGEVLETRTRTMQDMQKRKREFEFAVQPTSKQHPFYQPYKNTPTNTKASTKLIDIFKFTISHRYVVSNTTVCLPYINSHIDILTEYVSAIHIYDTRVVVSTTYHGNNASVSK